MKIGLPLVGALLNGLEAFSQPDSNHTTYIHPELGDYIPALVVGFVLGFVLCGIFMRIGEERFLKNMYLWDMSEESEMPEKKPKKKTPMEKLTAGYEKFIKGKEVDPNGAAKFDKALKKAAKPRSAK